MQSYVNDLASVIDSALDALGEPAKRALYYYLEQDGGIRIKPGEPLPPMKYLKRALASILGREVAEVIQEMINKQISKNAKLVAQNRQASSPL